MVNAGMYCCALACGKLRWFRITCRAKSGSGMRNKMMAPSLDRRTSHMASGPNDC
jgi:hypothetical protein